MKTLLFLSLQSLKLRKKIWFLTVFSIALSVFLLLSIDRVQKSVEENFTQTISQTDLIVGARGSGLQLLLYSVFNIGNATNNIGYDTFQKIKSNPAIEWTIPYSLGDGHKGFRVVATTQDFFSYYKFRKTEGITFAQGQTFNYFLDVVIGAEVAQKLNYKMGDKIVVSHGVTKDVGLVNHEDKPFRIVGILNMTGTPLDRAVYISLEGMEALHIDWQTGGMPQAGKEIREDQIKPEDLKPKTITSFFVRCKNRIDALNLQRLINTYEDEPLTAIIPGVVLSDLWQSLKSIDLALKSISWLVALVSLFSLLSIMLTALNERRREMALLRSLGASPAQIFMLLAIEGFLISFAACILGIILSWVGGLVIQPILLDRLGFRLSASGFGVNQLFYCLVVLVLGVIVSGLPALLAYRSSLKDGLSVKT